jgi:hypothetical protein
LILPFSPLCRHWFSLLIGFAAIAD